VCLIVTSTCFPAAVARAQAPAQPAPGPGEKPLTDDERKREERKRAAINDLVTKIKNLNLWQGEARLLTNAAKRRAQNPFAAADNTIKRLRPSGQPSSRALSPGELRELSAARTVVDPLNCQEKSIQKRQKCVSELNEEKTREGAWAGVGDEDIRKFSEAVDVFRATPYFFKAEGGSAAAALEDSTRRQAALRTMQYLALRHEPFKCCLLYVIMNSTQHYFHRFSPYNDKIVIPAGDVPGVASRSPVPGAMPASAASPRGIDPSGPTNNAQALQNSDVAIIAVLTDTVRKLEFESSGDDLFDWLCDDQPQIDFLVLSVLTDPDLSPSTDKMTEFLFCGTPKAAFARYFFVQKVIDDPSQVTWDRVKALVRQLDQDGTPLYSAIVPKVLLALQPVTGIVSDSKAVPVDYVDLGHLASFALTKATDATTRTQALAALDSFAVVGKKDKTLTEGFAKQLRAVVMDETAAGALGMIRSGKPADRDYAIRFVAACGPAMGASVVDGKLVKWVFSDDDLVALVGAFQQVMTDFETNDKVRKVAGIRISVANALSAMSPALSRTSPGAYAVYTQAYSMLQTALFGASADEQAAFLQALSALLRPPQ
jgi:hypothetical protein